MVKIIISDKLPRITKNRRRLQEKLNVRITNRGKEVKIEGEPEDEYIAEKVIDALNFGFEYSTAIQIKEEDFNFEILNIKEYTKKHDLKTVRARIIGTQRKALNTIEQLTNCILELKDNQVGIIGPAESIENAQTAVISIVQGAKQSNAYKFLEKNQPKPIQDLGLKEEK
jgi:KH domain-containing protein